MVGRACTITGGGGPKLMLTLTSEGVLADSRFGNVEHSERDNPVVINAIRFTFRFILPLLWLANRARATDAIERPLHVLVFFFANLKNHCSLSTRQPPSRWNNEKSRQGCDGTVARLDASRQSPGL